jgi:hypothetical protein
MIDGGRDDSLNGERIFLCGKSSGIEAEVGGSSEETLM